MWIEIEVVGMHVEDIESRLARALWIEIIFSLIIKRNVFVEARESLVD